MKKKSILLCTFALSALSLTAQPNTGWPEVKQEAKPGSRWWWLGSAVDEKNLTFNLEEYASKGMGSLEITPIYGLQNNDANDVSYLSERWMQLLKHTIAEGERLGISIDMSTGTGWPFGGPEVVIEDAASKLIVEEFMLESGELLNLKLEPSDAKQKATAKLEAIWAFGDNGKKIDLTNKVKAGSIHWKAPKGKWRVIAAFCGKTFQQVKRAAPGGEGYVIDHFSEGALTHYLGRFDKAFETGAVKAPHNFFNDSYEVYGADWTPGLLVEFKKRRGYALETYFPEFLSENITETKQRLISDYRETLSDMLLENFTNQWTSWANKRGSQTRNQAHGSPGNLVDLYAAVDVPECESFGISDYGIKGLRKDSLQKENDSDLTMLKYASSGAHISGKPFVSSETFTWLTEHFRTSLAQCKPDIDLMFLSGVNHSFFHGTPYSPKEAEWPGWLFYASVNMSPSNSIWRDAQPFFQYISRCQSFLQHGKPDNDFLVYLPVYDMWYEQKGRLLMFDIHKMKERAPKFIKAVNNILESGYDVDYISDNFIRNCRFENGKIVTEAGTSYSALIVPGAKLIPVDLLNHINSLTAQGATIAFLDNYPEDVPGLSDLQSRQSSFKKELAKLPSTNFETSVKNKLGNGYVITGNNYAEVLDMAGGKREVMKVEHGLQCVRRKNDEGYHYFIAALKPEGTKAWIPLGVSASHVELYHPVTGEVGVVASRKSKEGNVEVFLDINSGESVILKTITENKASLNAKWNYYKSAGAAVELKQNWTLQFVESKPAIAGTFAIDTLGSWTNLPIDQARINMGTARYRIEFDLNQQTDHWLLSLGDVRESARVTINGQEVATLWSVPYEVNVGKYLVYGKNVIEVDVTNLPANLIADYDKNGVQWRNFKEINMVNIKYGRETYANWEPVPSGLCGPVMLYPCETYHP